tara:strand:- start:171 stop:884 length:714 start_codon:yes stop_codon:yes gene_type:complete
MSEIRVNNIIDEAGTGAPTLPNGVTIQGNTTGTNLTLSGDLTVNGTTTTIDTAVTSVDSLEVDGNGTFGSIDVSSTSTDGVRALGGSGQLVVQRSSGASGRAIEIYDGSSRTIDIFANGTATFAGTVSDSIGPLRRLGINDQNGASTYTLVSSDAGKLINKANGGGVTVNTSTFSGGDMVSILNNSGSDFTITQGSNFSLYNTADASTGNRTLAGRGIVTIIFLDGNNGYISGSGLS